MVHQLPPLPYSESALEPHISKETIQYHYGKHHQAYVNNLNSLVKGTANESKTLEELVRTSHNGLFNNAAQVWNHTFYWNSLSPNGGGEPKGRVKVAIESQWESFTSFKAEFTKAAATHFGSGWIWLVEGSDGTLRIVSTHDAANPLRNGLKPLLCFDVWEHAYYVDYRNLRPKYIEVFWNLVNWEFVDANLSFSKL